MTPAEFLDTLDDTAILPSVGLTLWIVEDDAGGTSKVTAVLPTGLRYTVAERCLAEDAAYIAAHSPAVTAALRACARALVEMYADQIDYITRNKLSGAENNHAMKRAREALAALAAAGGDNGKA